MRRIQSLFERYSGIREYRISAIPASGGNRQYFRISWDGGSCIAAAGTSLRENGAFLYLDRHFSRLGLPVPEVLAVSDDRMVYLQEDLGDTTLFDAVAAGRRSGEYSSEEKTLLRAAVEALRPDKRDVRPQLFQILLPQALRRGVRRGGAGGGPSPAARPAADVQFRELPVPGLPEPEHHAHTL